MNTFPAEIWLKIIDNFGKPLHGSAYELDPSCSHTLTLISRTCKDLALYSEPMLYARVFVTSENVDLLARTTIKQSDQAYNAKKRGLIKMISIKLSNQHSAAQLARIAAVIRALQQTLSSVCLDFHLRWVTRGAVARSVHNAVREIAAAVRSLPNLEQLCIARGPECPLIWRLSPKRAPWMKLKRLAICDLDLFIRSVDMLLCWQTLETCIVEHGSRKNMVDGSASLEDLFRPGAHAKLKEFVAAVSPQCQPALYRRTMRTLSVIMEKPVMETSAGGQRHLVKVAELSGFKDPPDVDGDPERKWFAEAIADGSIWNQDSVTWDEYQPRSLSL